MANLLGMVFGMGARDMGMKSGLDAAIDGLEEIGDQMEDQEEQREKSKRSVREWIDSFNLASISNNVSKLTGETGNLSSSLESMALSNAQAIRPIIQSMNLGEKAARRMENRISSMAIGMEVGAADIAQTFKSIHNAGETASKGIDAMGMSEKQWVKVTQTTGVTMDQFSALLGDMIASWGASPKQAAKMLNSLVEIGKKAKIGTRAIQGAKAHYDALGAIFERLPPSMARTADQIQNIMESTYKLSGAFVEMGKTEEEAARLAEQTAAMFASQSTQIELLYKAGREGEIADSPIIEFMTQLGYSTDEAREILRVGSEDVVKGVARINEAFVRLGGRDSRQLDNALSKLSESLGQGAAGLGFLVQSSDIGAKALARMNAMVVSGTDQLRKYGEASLVVNRNLQDQVNRSKELMEQDLRRIGRADALKYAKRQMEAYSATGKAMKKWSKGMFGGALKYLSVLKQAGLKGVLSTITEKAGGEEAAKAAAKFGVGLELALGTARTVGEELDPLLSLLGKFGPVGQTLGLVGTGVGIWSAMGEKGREEFKAKMEPVFKWLKDRASEIWDEMVGPDGINKLVAGLNEAINKIVDWASIGVKMFSKIPWDKITENLVLALDKAFGGESFLFGAAAKRIKKERKRESSKKEQEAIFESSIKEIRDLEQKLWELRTGVAPETIIPVEQQIADIEKLIQSKKERIGKAGQEIDKLMGIGIEEGSHSLGESMTKALQSGVISFTPHSPAEKGPLSGDALPSAGRGILSTMSQGIFEQQPIFQEDLAQALEDSIIYGINAYEQKVEELFSKSKVLENIAKQLVQQVGAKLDIAPTTDVNVETRKELVTLLSMPGLAGVTAAIVTEGHKQRKILTKIEEHTLNISEQTKGLTIPGGQSPVLAS